MSLATDVTSAVAQAAAVVAELEGAPSWAVDGAVELLQLAERLATKQDPSVLDDVEDTLAEIGKAALDAKKFGGSP